MSFIFKITTTTSPQNFVIPCVDEGTFNATVDYGDGTGSQTVTAYNDANLTHSFATAGQHTITIDGSFPNISFYNNASSRTLVDEVVDLGDVGWLYLFRAFRNCTNLTDFNVGTADISNVTNTAEMFHTCNDLTTLDLSNLDTSNVTDMFGMFRSCTGLTSLDLSNFNTSSVTTMQQMFFNCSSLTTLNVSNFNTSSVTNMSLMFYLCSSLTALNVSSFDTSIVTNMSSIFYYCATLTTLNVSSFDTSSVNNMSSMFRNCSSLTTLDLSNFDTSSVTTMSIMFFSCSSLTTLDLSNFDTSSVTNMSMMFFSCSSLTSLDVSSFNTSSVTSTSIMFYNCSSLTSLDVSSFNTSSVTNMSMMFYNCATLTNLNIKHFNISSVTNGSNFLLNSNDALTTIQYDDLLEAWAIQDVQPNVSWHFGDAQHTVENIADWYAPNATSSLSIINNKIVSIADSTSTFGASQQVDNLVIGNTYTIVGAATCNNNASTVYIRVSPNVGMNSPIFDVSKTAIATVNSTFIATATTLYVGVIVTGHAANDTLTIDASTAVREITNYGDATANSNIEYSQENVFGSEEVVNGDFATDSDWNKGNLWTINNGTAIYSGVSGSANISQSNTTTTGKSYRVTVDMIQNDGTCSLRTNSGTTVIGDVITGTGSFSFVFLATGSEITFRAGFNTNPVIIDNISVKEITNAVTYENIPDSARELYTLENDTWTGSNELVTNGDFATDSDWNKRTGWTINNGTANFDGTTNDAISQSIGLVENNDYKVTFTVSNISQGGIAPVLGGSLQLQTITANGTYTLYSKSGVNPLVYFQPVSNFTGSIDNVSVKEVIEVAS